MILSVHLPKTAGRSFRDLLKSHYNEHFRDDYDNPIDIPVKDRIKKAKAHNLKFALFLKYLYYLKGIKCIHGHFLPLKYSHATLNEKHHFVTWLRDPIDRLVSNYFYRMNNYIKQHNEDINNNSFYTFKDYCLLKESINVYSQYLYHFPLDLFSFRAF